MHSFIDGGRSLDTDPVSFCTKLSRFRSATRTAITRQEAKSRENGRIENYFGRSEQSVTPGFTIDNLCKALGVDSNYSFLPMYLFRGISAEKNY